MDNPEVTPNKVPELDNDTKTELKNLASTIDVREKDFSPINNLLGKLNTIPEEKKNLALQYALKETPIKIGNGGEKKLGEIARLFDKAVEQDGNTWKIKLKENVELSNEEKGVLEPFLNEKDSSLAYLIQKASNFAKVEAQKGYGQEADKLVDIRVDRTLGNQTRRALSGLKSWIESDIQTIDLTTLTEEQLQQRKFLPKSFLSDLKDNNSALFDKFWSEDENGNITPQEWYEFANPYTNNYAVREWKAEEWKKGEKIETPESIESTIVYSTESLSVDEINKKIDELKKQQNVSKLMTLTITIGMETFAYSFEGLSDDNEKKAALNSLPIYTEENGDEEENSLKTYIFTEGEWKEKRDKATERSEKVEDLVNKVARLAHEDIGSEPFEAIKEFTIKTKADWSFSFWDIFVKPKKDNQYTFSIKPQAENSFVRSSALIGTPQKTLTLSLDTLDQAKEITTLMNAIFAFANGKETWTDDAKDIERDNWGVNTWADNNPFYFGWFIKGWNKWSNTNLTFSSAWSRWPDYDIMSTKNLEQIWLKDEVSLTKFAKFITTWANYKFDG